MKKRTIQSEWDFKKFYSSFSDPQILKDAHNEIKKVKTFVKKYSKDLSYTQSPKKLLAALQDYEKLYLYDHPCIIYPYLASSLDSNNKEAAALLGKIENMFIHSAASVIFFVLAVQKIDKKNQNIFLASKELLPYRHVLSGWFKDAKYTLPKEQEEILTKTSKTRSGMWHDLTDRVFSNMLITYKKKSLTVNQAMHLMITSKKNIRDEVLNYITQAYKATEVTTDAGLNSIVTNKKVNDELRGYKSVFESSLLKFDVREKELFSYLNAAEKNISISHTYHNWKASILNQKKLSYADRLANVTTSNVKFTFEKIHDLMLEFLESLSLEFKEYYIQMIQEGRIDVYPKKGKYTGGYCLSTSLVAPYILLNHTNSVDSFITLTHEFGHALHAYYTKKQLSPLNQNYSFVLAETASITLQRLGVRFLINKYSDETLYLLESDVSDDIKHFFRMAHEFNFEKALHKKGVEDGIIATDTCAELFVSEVQKMCGNIYAPKPLDGYMFMRNFSHLYNHFYNYPYAFGAMVSRYISDIYATDQKKALNYYIIILQSGGNVSPKHVYQSIGLKTESTTCWDPVFVSLAKDIQTLKKLSSKKN